MARPIDLIDLRQNASYNSYVQLVDGEKNSRQEDDIKVFESTAQPPEPKILYDSKFADYTSSTITAVTGITGGIWGIIKCQKKSGKIAAGVGGFIVALAGISKFLSVLKSKE